MRSPTTDVDDGAPLVAATADECSTTTGGAVEFGDDNAGLAREGMEGGGHPGPAARPTHLMRQMTNHRSVARVGPAMRSNSSTKFLSIEVGGVSRVISDDQIEAGSGLFRGRCARWETASLLSGSPYTCTVVSSSKKLRQLSVGTRWSERQPR